jgi:hypothetical protein
VTDRHAFRRYREGATCEDEAEAQLQPRLRTFSTSGGRVAGGERMTPQIRPYSFTHLEGLGAVESGPTVGGPV